MSIGEFIKDKTVVILWNMLMFIVLAAIMLVINVNFIIIVFAFVCGITYLMFILSKRIAERLKPSIIKAISRIMGLILAVIAVQMLINGVFNVIREFNG
jgi:small neutral amino acid transporter SnatA (MarC family)